jgi:4'-phosphopantetheinyl transferase
VHAFFKILADDEKRRAERFHFAEDRERFTVARGALRVLLTRYVNAEPTAIRFTYNSYGKPALVSDQPVRFNVSHSGGVALYAVAKNREVGVDVERVRPEFAGEAIAERFFSPREVEALRGLPRSQIVEGFFNCWTRKEAYIKARGKGLSIPLDKFDVSLAPGETAVLYADRDCPAETGRWQMWNLCPGPGFAGAAAVEGHGCHVWRGDASDISD